MQNKEYKTVYFSWAVRDNTIKHTLNADGVELWYWETEPISKVLNKYAAEGWVPINISGCSSGECLILLERVCPPPKDTIS